MVYVLIQSKSTLNNKFEVKNQVWRHHLQISASSSNLFWRQK